MTITATEVTDFLNSLGVRGVEVAVTLRTSRIKGLRMENTMCPISNALRKHFSNVAVSSGPYAITVYDALTKDEIMVETPYHITEFIRDFDNGKYPELDRFAHDDSN